MFYSRMSGLGYYLPKKTLTNADLERITNTSDTWIRQRTGIHSRHIAGENELPSDMGCHAAVKALKQAGLTAQDLDLIITATLYPDQLMPNASCVLQQKLKARPDTPALDISAACSGFVYALSIANQFIKTGAYKHILVAGAETLHHVTNYQDRTTCILFGDGAGACILSQNTQAEKGCIYHQELKAYGHLGHWLYIPSPGAKRPPQAQFKNADYCIQMEGAKVFKKAVEVLCTAYHQALKATGRTLQQLDWIVPHQANERILKQFCKVTGCPEKKVIFDIQTTGNTSAASIPISMARAVEQGRIQRGQVVLLLAVGGGMSSGSILLKY